MLQSYGLTHALTRMFVWYMYLEVEINALLVLVRNEAHTIFHDVQAWLDQVEVIPSRRIGLSFKFTSR